MPVPDFQTVMLPLLQYADDGEVHLLREAIEALANKFALTEQERQELLPSGRQAVFANRVGWARTHLFKAGLLQSPKRGFFQITDRGKSVLDSNPPRITMKLLDQFLEYTEFRSMKRDGEAVITTLEKEPELDAALTKTPQELIELGYQQFRKALEIELLEQVKSCSPAFFEKLVVRLLISMGYGGSSGDAGQVTKRSGDGGIDGVIKEDKLGLSEIYVQAKRWEDSVVGRPEIQKFVGALHGHNASKGVFITTSKFSEDANRYATGINLKIVLVDGQKLAQLMVDHGVGVSTSEIYEIKKIDSDYFIEE